MLNSHSAVSDSSGDSAAPPKTIETAESTISKTLYDSIAATVRSHLPDHTFSQDEMFAMDFNLKELIKVVERSSNATSRSKPRSEVQDGRSTAAGESNKDRGTRTSSQASSFVQSTDSQVQFSSENEVQAAYASIRMHTEAMDQKNEELKAALELVYPPLDWKQVLLAIELYWAIHATTEALELRKCTQEMCSDLATKFAYLQRAVESESKWTSWLYQRRSGIRSALGLRGSLARMFKADEQFWKWLVEWSPRMIVPDYEEHVGAMTGRFFVALLLAEGSDEIDEEAKRLAEEDRVNGIVWTRD